MPTAFDHHSGPVRRFGGRIGLGEHCDALSDILPQIGKCAKVAICRAANRRSRPHEAFPPAPQAGFRFAGSAHDLPVPTPSALNRTISALRTCLCGALRSRASVVKRRPSADLGAMEISVRIRQTRTYRVRGEPLMGFSNVRLDPLDHPTDMCFTGRVVQLDFGYLAGS
jgi:hypothetical protein